MKKIKVLHIQFHSDLKQNEIELFRGAVLSKMDDASVLFHNHTVDNYRYSYPLIQYKRIYKKASILCLEEGTEAIGQFFSSGDFNFRLGERAVKMEVNFLKAHQYLVQIWDSMFVYRIYRWLPLNETNYQEYKKLDGIVEQCAFLEKKLIGNILSFAKGINLCLDKEIICKILQIEDPYVVSYKGTKMMTFNICFKTNISLPNYIGLGKGVSIGNGIVMREVKK